MPVPRLSLSAVSMALVVAAVLVVLVLSGQLAAEPAAAAFVAITVVQALLLRALIHGIARIRHALDQLLTDDLRVVPAVRSASPTIDDLWLAIMRLTRSWRERLRRMQGALDGSNAVLLALPDPLLVINDRREIVRANPAALALFSETLGGAPPAAGPSADPPVASSPGSADGPARQEAPAPDSAMIGRDLAVALRNPAVLAATDAVLRGSSPRVVEFNLSLAADRHMIARVTALPGRLDEGTAALIMLHDVTSQRRTEQMRADFAANASHELRTPLSTLIGFIETLQGPAADDVDAQRRFLAIMQQQAGRMSRLVDDLLSLSRIELNEHTPPTDQLSLAMLLEGLAATLELKAAARRMAIELSLPLDPPTVIGDSEELAQVFQNLIDNAIKYGRPGTPVTVTVSASTRMPNSVAVAVRDQGDGIPRLHLPRLTERFYRVDTARSREMGGTGLGLAIVKHIVNRHRGVLEIDSELGEGSTFTVHLRTARRRRVETPPSDDQASPMLKASLRRPTG
ncbi:MAG TPA: ATP-binding protein [Stellaceae bacterium]|nr:ATP-binding protein [Stellaceae bacterium]